MKRYRFFYDWRRLPWIYLPGNRLNWLRCPPLQLVVFGIIAVAFVVCFIAPGHGGKWATWTPAEPIVGMQNTEERPITPEMVARVTDSMMWLVFANGVSALSVGFLLLDLLLLQRKLSGKTFEMGDREDHLQGNENPVTRKSVPPDSETNPVNWATRPLFCFYVVAFLVFFALVILVMKLLFMTTEISTGEFFQLSAVTGLGYILLMTFGDFWASCSYRRCSWLKQPDNTLDEDRKEFEEFMDSLSDYPRFFRFVDWPIIAGLVAVLGHKIWGIGVMDGYHWGFIAGAVAMHVVIANVVSLVISMTHTRVELDDV